MDRDGLLERYGQRSGAPPGAGVELCFDEVVRAPDDRASGRRGRSFGDHRDRDHRSAVDDRRAASGRRIAWRCRRAIRLAAARSGRRRHPGGLVGAVGRRRRCGERRWRRDRRRASKATAASERQTESERAHEAKSGKKKKHDGSWRPGRVPGRGPTGAVPSGARAQTAQTQPYQRGS